MTHDNWTRSEKNKLYLLNTVQIIQTCNYTGLCLFVMACQISVGFTLLAWKAEIVTEISSSREAEFIKLICRKMTTSSPSNTPVLATNMLTSVFFQGRMLYWPQGFLWGLVYGFHLNFLCEHATRHRSLSLWGHCFYVILMLHERCGVNILQNFFCYEKTSLPNMKLDADVH